MASKARIAEVKDLLRKQFPDLHTASGQVARSGSVKIKVLRALQVSLTHPSITLETQFTKVNDVHGFSCTCGHRWEAKVSDVVNKGSGCMLCSGKSVLTEAEVDSRLEGREVTRVSKYLNLHSKITWRCTKGHTWDASTSQIVHQKAGCPYCAGHSKDCIYIWKEEGTEYYKVGISSLRRARVRIAETARRNNMEYEVVLIQGVAKPRELEKHIHNLHTNNPYITDTTLDGNTEFRQLSEKELNTLLQLIKENANELKI